LARGGGYIWFANCKKKKKKEDESFLKCMYKMKKKMKKKFQHMNINK
jgi:hypothetical protein